SAGKSAYDMVFRRTLHLDTLKKNHNKLHFLKQRIKLLTDEIMEMNRKVTDKQRLEAIKEELTFLKTKIQLLKC
ncbi:hypothetical protein HYY69_06650, partial [Candidatus Woesearchaeota archaeon]|nr:hypothetical protein [Candidatus Woesearchaeota archaeon]